MLTDLVDACRKSGLEVVEIDGWRTRGHGDIGTIETIVAHHTATAASAPGDYPSLRIVRDGRSDLAGPLAQLGLGRSGTVYVIAAGLCFHAGETFTSEQGNFHAIGIEAEHDGISPWPVELVDAYARLCAALCQHYGLSPFRVLGHKEVAAPLGRKTDPNFDMDAFRARVIAVEQEELDVTEEQLRTIIREELANAGDLVKLPNPKDPNKPKWSLSTYLTSIYKRTA